MYVLTELRETRKLDISQTFSLLRVKLLIAAIASYYWPVVGFFHQKFFATI